MTWNFHNYYANRSEGLISKLKLSDKQLQSLQELRTCVRSRIKDVFEEAKELAKTENVKTISLESVKEKVAKTRLGKLSKEDQEEVSKLMQDMDEPARKAFLSLAPRFWTQGSFQYNTLNNPYTKPPQEMDIDDGTYLPMAIFEDRPVIGHRLLILLVDASLKSLVDENSGWKFEAKKTCARIKIPQINAHIDVPMYAIPEEQFSQKQVALESIRKDKYESYNDYAEAWINNRDEYELDSNCVNLALREGEQKWVKSDPKIIEDWFNESCQRIGRHLRKLCRFMKSWRDTQWSSGGPSSISLMVATVSILDSLPHDKDDFGAAIKLVADNIEDEFARGVENPDTTVDQLLFPPIRDHGEAERDIMDKLRELKVILAEAEVAETKELALKNINRAFGLRVSQSDLIISKKSAPAFKDEPTAGEKSKRISTTMSSG